MIKTSKKKINFKRTIIMRRISVFNLLFTLGVLLNFSAASASIITPVQDDVSFTSSADNDFLTSGDLLTLHAANSAGISYNEFTTFSVSGSTLKLINIPTFDSDSNRVEAPNLIIIKANNITLNGRIELAGAPADILFISTSNNGQVSCTGCEIAGFSRATLAVATSSNTFDDAMSAVGELQTQASGVVSINNLDAPGIYHLEVLASTFNNSGTIDINVSINDQRQPDLNGDLTLGAGAIDAYLGDMEWNYESQSISGLTPTDTLQEIGANFNGIGIKISTSGQLNVTGSLNTKVDVLSASIYKGEDRLPSENITLQAFNRGSSDENQTTFLSGDLVTNGNIIVKANRNLELVSGGSKISAGYQEYAVTYTLNNYRNLFAHNIKMAAKSILNRATIEVVSKLEMHANSRLINHFGGKLLGDNVVLQSSSGFVRNGSRTPYLNTVLNEYLLDYTTSYLTFTDKDTSKLGTYYKYGIDVSVINDHEKPTDTSAHISARILSVKALGFENINPYWEDVSSDGSVEFTRERLTQVSVLASEKLIIDAKTARNYKGYVLNSSSILQVTGASGSIIINTDYVVNQRYRNLTLIDYIQDAELMGVVDESGAEPNPAYELEFSKQVFSRAYTYSPPGVMLSLGNVWIAAVAGVINEASFFEVYGDASFFTGNNTTYYPGGIFDRGIAQGGVAKSESWFFIDNCTSSSEECKWAIYDAEEKYEVSDTRSAPSLFLVNGDILEGPKFSTVTLNAWQGLQEQAAYNVLEEYEPYWYDGKDSTSITNKPTYFIIVKTDSEAPQVITDEDRMFVTWEETVSRSVYNLDEKGVGVYQYTNVYPESETLEFSLIDTMIDFYNLLEETFNDLVNEYKWWD